MTLQQKVEKIVSEAGGTFGIAIKHLQTGERASINENELFQLASCFKIPVMATLYRDAEEGKIDLDERVRITAQDYRTGSGVLEALDPGAEISVKDLAMLMTIVSDNVATDVLMNMVGTENVDYYMKELGFKTMSVKHDVRDAFLSHMGYSPDEVSSEETQRILREELIFSKIRGINVDDAPVFQPTPDNNVSTPTEMCELLEMIATKQLISKAACDGMINILASQKLRDRIPYLLPAEAKAACKTGTVGSVVNDAGIVYLPEDKGAFVIVAFSRDNAHVSEGNVVISNVAKIAYEHFLSNS